MADRFDTFTERARRVLSLAQEEAQRLGHSSIGTEHLLLGMLRLGDGAGLLRSLGVTLEQARAGTQRLLAMREPRPVERLEPPTQPQESGAAASAPRAAPQPASSLVVLRSRPAAGEAWSRVVEEAL